MVSNKFRLLAAALLVVGAASVAYACGDEKDKSSSNAQASFVSSEAGCCAKSAKNTTASKVAAGECAAHKSTSTSTASFASTAGGDHCAAAKGAKNATAECTYGENTVTYSGACPAGKDADYSFAIASAECRGTGAAAAKAIKSVKGVASVTVDYSKGMAYVCADKSQCNEKAIAKCLKNAGFDDVKFVSASKENCAKSHGKIDA